MIKLCFLLSILISVNTGISYSQNAVPIRFAEAEYYWKHKHVDTLLIVNFWATWCKPCVEELPYFEQIQKEFLAQKVKVILVSQDDPEQLDSRVNAFIRKKKLQSEVWLMTESNPNTWIDAVDVNWTGAIPATLIVKPNGSYAGFHEKSLNYEELKSLIHPLLP